MDTKKILELNLRTGDAHKRAIIDYPDSWTELWFTIINLFEIDPLFSQITWNKITLKPKSFQTIKESKAHRIIWDLHVTGKRSYFSYVLNNYIDFKSEMNRDVQELYKHVLIEGSANVKSVYLLYTNLAKNYNHVLLLLPFLSQLESLSFGSKRHKFERISIIDQPNFYGERSFSLEKRLSTIVQNLIGFDYLPCLFQIGQLLLNLPVLKTIDFSYSFSNFERLTEFFPVFLNIKTIETLNFSGITAKDEEIHILFRILAEMPNLTSLEMNDCGLNNENINELNAFTGKATLLDRLKVLSIRNSYFKDKNNSNITNVIEKCSKLEMLDLSSCNLSEKGMWNMQYALMSQIKLKKLYLANNKLAKTGEYFLAFLPRLINLEHLDISNNNIGTAYVRKIIDILPCSIELLDISNNNKNLDIFLSINQRIKHWNSLKFLHAAGIITGESIEAAENYMNFLDDASKLTQFDISFLHLSVPATLYDKLAKCLHLRILSLGNIGITFETFPSFSHMIQLLVNLEILYLKQSKCEDKILERMCMLLGEHKMISVVGFEHAALTNKKDWVLHRYNLFNRDFTQYPDYAIIRNPEKIPGSCLIKKCDLCKANCGFLDLCEWARRRPVVVLRKHASSYKYV